MLFFSRWEDDMENAKPCSLPDVESSDDWRIAKNSLETRKESVGLCRKPGLYSDQYVILHTQSHHAYETDFYLSDL